MKQLLRWVAFLGLLAALIHAGKVMMLRQRHFSTHGHAAGRGLHADVLTRNASIGIPGINKMYEAELTNFGMLPALTRQCDYLSDAMARGTMVAYSVERWDHRSGAWQSVVDMNNAEFCAPAPLSIVEASLTARWLWPGQSVRTEEEATAAREPLRAGDTVRFRVYVRTGDSKSESVATNGFVIDESRTEDTGPLRLRH